ncbi:MAG: DUF4943 family protein [Bacteroidales bacterium]|nr:DUF4943 family protein [Bacteroidales bacterium]
MKKIIILLMILSLFTSGTKAQKSIRNKIHITVIDKKNGLPVENAEVTLTTIVEARDVYKEIRLTNTAGKCSFKINFSPSIQYYMQASKTGYLGFLEMDPVKISKHDAIISRDTPEKIFLYLTSDSLHQVEFYRNTEVRYEIPVLINLFKSGNFHGGIPLMHWNDIPQLLAVANDKALISSYPANPLSSSAMEAPLGLVALWLIESIRIAEGNRFILPWQKYPSLNPLILNINDPTGLENKNDNLEKAYKAYREWWEVVRDMDSMSGCRINPLKGTGIGWN